jgi:hypothetical protein
MREPAPGQHAPRYAREFAVQLLKECLRDPIRIDAGRVHGLLSRTTPDVVVGLATYHRVGGMVYEALRRLGGDEPVIRRLGQGYETAVRGHMRILWELARLKPVLDATTGRWAVIKGPVIVESLYDAPGRRAYADLDVLVEPSSFGDVLRALERAGSPVLDTNWRVLLRDLRGEVHMFLPGGTPLDLHWNVINMYRRNMWIDSTELLDRTVGIDLGGVSVKTLDDADTLLNLAVHAGLSGGDRLIWLKDMERAAALRPPSWEVVVERARRWNVAGSVGMMLARAIEVLGAEIPDWVPRRLLRRGTATLIHAVDRVSPWELSMGRLTAANVMLSRSIAHGLKGGSRWTLQRAIRNFDPREPAASSAFTPTGGESERDAFIDAVVRSGARLGR